jgi:DNA modification methylase
LPHIQPLKIEMAPLAELTVSPRHTRRVTRPQLRRVKRSISKFGFIVPILIDACGRIIAGAVRVEAAKALGYSEAPSIRLEHLTPEQVEAFAIAENRLVETGEWDDDMLAVVFKDLSALDLDFGLDITGFTLPEIDLKIAGLDQGADAADDPDDRTVPPGPSVVQHGDLWTLGRHRLICGSCLETEVWTRLMAGAVAAIIIADLPYNCAITGHVSSTDKFREFAMASGEMGEAEFQAFMLQACHRMAQFSQDGALSYLFMDWRNIHGLLGACREAYDALVNLCVWVKPQGGMGSFYRSAHELIAVVKKGAAPHQNNVQLGRFGRDRRNTFFYPGANAFLRSGEDAEFAGQHPTPKPVHMLADILMDASSRGELVVDPFCGSGATLIAAERMGRRCNAIELDPLYCDLIIRRWQRHTGQVALREDGESFIDLERRAAP